MKPQLSAIVLTLLAFSGVNGKDFTVGQVLSHPRDFAGKRISVTGFYVAANEESSLYITPEAAKRGDIDRSIWVQLHRWPLNSNRAVEFSHALKPYRENRDDGLAGYVRFVGTFHYRFLSRDAAREGRGYGQWGLSPSQLDVTSFTVLR